VKSMYQAVAGSSAVRAGNVSVWCSGVRAQYGRQDFGGREQAAEPSNHVWWFSRSTLRGEAARGKAKKAALLHCTALHPLLSPVLTEWRWSLAG
jgi:hypothetical protein